jgi:hypothetical protein
MAYRKTNLFMRKVFNPLAMKFGIGGAHTLIVASRDSDEVQRTPIIPLEYEGERYLVSPRGETEWVRNLRAAGGGELGSKRGNESFRATEIPAGERPPILAAYREEGGKTVEPHFEALPDPADHPVFLIEAR